MDPRLLNECQYHIMPGKLGPTQDCLNTHNATYRFWKEFWTEVLKGNGTDEKLNPDEFSRQSFVTAITCGDEIVGMHTYNQIDLRSVAMRDHSYFSHFYPQEFFSTLKNERVEHTLTMEFFSVAPAWRASKAGVSLGSVLVGLGLCLASEQAVDAVITVARTDVAAGKVAAEQGAVPIIKDLNIYNTPCDIIAFYPRNFKSPADPHANTLIKHFWRNRFDHTQNIQLSTLQQAA